MRYSTKFTDEPESVPRAYHWEADVPAEHQLSSLGHAASDITELRTNAVRHARSPYQVTIEVGPHEVMAEVVDHSQGLPAQADPARAEFGRTGLFFVGSQAASWGSRPVAGGKVLFFALDITAGDRSDR